MKTVVRHHIRHKPKGGYSAVRTHQRCLSAHERGEKARLDAGETVYEQGRYAEMSLDELIREHRKLVKILKEGTDEEQRREAESQEKELGEYIKHRKQHHSFHKSGVALHGTLTYKERQSLPPRQFAEPSKRKYPIHDVAHARNALARVAAYGTPKEQAVVRKAVHERYPSIDKR